MNNKIKHPDIRLNVLRNLANDYWQEGAASNDQAMQLAVMTLEKVEKAVGASVDDYLDGIDQALAEEDRIKEQMPVLKTGQGDYEKCVWSKVRQQLEDQCVTLAMQNRRLQDRMTLISALAVISACVWLIISVWSIRGF